MNGNNDTVARESASYDRNASWVVIACTFLIAFLGLGTEYGQAVGLLCAASVLLSGIRLSLIARALEAHLAEEPKKYVKLEISSSVAEVMSGTFLGFAGILCTIGSVL